LNILKTLDLPAAVALAATRTKTILYTNEDNSPWTYPQSTLKTLTLEKNLQLRQLPPPEK
jgi:hypothetical protein